MATLSRLGALRLSSRLVRMLPAIAATKESLVPVRSFASAKSSAAATKSSSNADTSLLKLLKSEIEHEKKQQKEESKDSLKAPSPFTLEDKPGSQEVILRRSYGSEDIAVTCVFRISPYDEQLEEEEDDDEADQPVSQEEVEMTVTIAKGGDSPVLEISCTCSQGEITIEKVSYLESPSAKDDRMAYDGPEFDELDEELQEQFKKYLDARGINDELCNFLVNFMPEKERQEYVRWMENVANFVRK